ncbi:alpha-D-ribose 1-methylphosphonate 5-triphosphate diphosphatase [Gordonia alkanivorans]|uniref:alpha-D-ribose 1-methylphosphonate 5-triphosphate diphosphatase n=1 Tax=Gordonia alkanivorans TaxID=84096 RepID=UPI002447A93A|nr:alpha-D-ribose 1-methylphosphonate 5-triphosphate diphosphatase [Gordonia alkanivorans]MDH3016881.1 alpha-D-ribose 1-methylphosphonate 5-triphosphate diphosphatase [Gordonia alkanivorans]MDH3042126.1 alpha-D-ribose 1-methylphosphonate 5-triphosphate diphosphatase [Gordonia alkanivorans]
MSNDTVLSNARIVLEDQILHGSVLIRDGLIADIGLQTSPAPRGADLEGDYLMPGVVEVHTDHLEYHFTPRPGVFWDPLPAVLAHDAQMAAAGATTVLDAVRIGSESESEDTTAAAAHRLADAVTKAVDAGLLRADHAIHLRCEVSTADCVDAFNEFADDPHVRLASLMDHAPGERQFADVEQFKKYYGGKHQMSPEDLDRYISERIDQSQRYSDLNRKTIAALAVERGITLAAHDDATEEHVDESLGLGVHISEFPTTIAAAESATRRGLQVVMGAPNIARGGSQSGNVAAADLLERGLLHILSSDYVPASPLQAVFQLAGEGSLDLVAGSKLISGNPARAVGFDDRGEIAIGKRADLVRVRSYSSPTHRRPGGVDVPVVRGVYRAGTRVT